MLLGIRARNLALLLAGASALPLAFAAPALSQDEEASDAGGDRIVVTARRREESLQDVPLAVTALSGDELDRTGAVDVTSIQTAVPNVTFVVSRGTNSTLTTFIRGVGQQDPLWGYEQGVGLYVDDVYFARAQGAVLDIFDIERVEVLRGPQGTLYGRNTIGGAIRYVTRRHSDEPEFRARVNVGSYSQFDYIFSGSVPLSDQFSVGGAFARYTRDGFGTNLFTGADHYNKDVIAGRLSAEFAPTNNLFFRLTGDFVNDDSNAKHGHRRIPGEDGEPVLANIFDTQGGLGDRNEVNTYGYSLLGEWDVNDTFTFKSITAYRNGETPLTPIDFDTLPEPDFDVPARYYDDQFTQEFQLLFDAGRFSGVAGLYYLDGNARGEFDVVLQEVAPGFASPLTGYTAGDVDRRSIAAYADVSFDITDRWSASLGGRYTEDETTADIRNELWLGLGSGTFDPTNVGSGLLSVRTNLVDLNRTDTRFTPRASISFDASPDLNLYASVSQGFKSGGFDPRGRTDLDPTGRVQEGFAPEIVTSYELGAKGSFFDDILNLNAAFFFADYTDQQIILQQGADSDADGINDTFQSLTLNAGASEYTGLELEGSVFLTDALTATFNFGWIDAEITEIIAPDPISGLPTNQAANFVVQNTPEYTGSIGLNYVRELADNRGEIALSGSANYRGEYNIFNVANDGFAPGVFPEYPTGGPSLEPEARTIFDASAVWTSANDQWRFGLHGRNLSDEEVRVALYNFLTGARLGSDSAYSSFYAPPRTFTASLEFRY